MKNLFAGLDVSTQSCKLIVIDLDLNNVVFNLSLNYDRDLPQYDTLNGTRKNAGFGVSESDPNMWIEAINILFERLSKESNLISEIKAISVSGQQHGLVTIKSDGSLSLPYSKLWNDFSTLEECELLTKSVGGKENMIKLIGNTQRTGYTAPKILHMLRHEPENYRKTKTVFLVHNYINWFLTGGKNGGIALMEQGDVSGSALWNPVSKSWAKEIINAISPDLMEKLPMVKDSRIPIGKIGKKFVKNFGFSEDCLIASGSGDNMMGAIGTGNFVDGIVTVSLGTSGTAYTCMNTPFVDLDGEIACFCDATGKFLPLLCISNMANGYEAILKKFSLDHNSFNEIIDKTNPGNNGRVLIPWYEGERTPDLPEAAPIYFGFDVNDFTKEILCRAALEGHIMNLYEGFSKLPIKSKEIRLTGGISKSRVWCETIANIFNCTVVPVLGEGTALGASIHAAWTYFPKKTMNEIADPFIQFDENNRIEPSPKIVESYSVFKRLYIALSRRIRGLTGEDPFNLFARIQKRNGKNV